MAASGKGSALTGLLLARRRRGTVDLLVKARPGDAAPVVFDDLIFTLLPGGSAGEAAPLPHLGLLFVPVTSFDEDVADSAAGSETVAGALTVSQAVTDSAAATDAAAAELVAADAVADSAAASDAAEATASKDEAVADSAAATDTATASAVLAEAVSDAAAGSETAVAVATFAEAVSDSAASSESVSDSLGSVTYNESAEDTAAASETVASLAVLGDAVSDSAAGSETVAISSAPPVTTAYPGPAGKSRGKRRRVLIGERLYNVLERDIPALLEAELLDRAPPVTAEVIKGPKPPRKRAKRAAPQPVKTVEQVRETVQQIKRRIEPDDAWLAQALEAVAFRVLERLQDEEDSLMLLLAA